jgi:NitT/TauT family transport system substrate-binding protein
VSQKTLTHMFAGGVAAAVLVAGLTACSSSTSKATPAATTGGATTSGQSEQASTQASGAASTASSATGDMPTVTLMVGGIDKQIYLPYQLAQGLGYYKKYGVNVKLSTEQEGGVGAEDAVASGQVNMAGAWYVHTIDFQTHGKDVIDVVQLSGAPGEREMCATKSGVQSPADWKGKNVGVTDLGSGTDDLTLYLAAKNSLTTKQFTRVGVGAGSTFISALQHGKIVCGMTSQPTVAAIEKQGLGYSAVDLASTEGAQKWLGGAYPAAGVLAQADWVNSHKDTVQKVVDALVDTMHYINTHSAADIADHMPPNFVANGAVTRDDYIKALDQDKGQFLPDGMMPADGPQTVLAIQKLAGKVTGSVDLTKTYTNDFAIAANKLEGYTK